MTTAGSHVLNFLYYMFTRGSLRHSDVIDIIYDTEGTHQGRLWMHLRACMGSHESQYGFT